MLDITDYNVCDHELRPLDEYTDECVKCGATGPYDDPGPTPNDL